MEDFILREMEEWGADGVDFIPTWFDTSFPPVLESYTKQEWVDSDKFCPKTNRMYWRMENGQKVYINPNTKIYKQEEAYKFDIKEILKGIRI